MVSFRWTVKGLSHRTTRIRSPQSPSHARCVAPAAAAPALRPRPPGREREAGGREMAVNPAGPTPYHLLPAPHRQEVADGPRGVPCAPWRRARDLTCREPTRDIPLVTKVMRKEARHTHRRDRASGVPPDILEHLPPKTRVCLLYCFVLSPLTLLGAVPHHHLALSDQELTYSSN